ncbi:hypothetical protein BJY52DRAFT_1199675 [Lactarius psammicola]|nr:hypothetical protein BJY52DRAFT_1199675 [Lactarius psammicola]
MSVEVGTSILDAALACISERLSAILLRPADGGRNYITSLHNEVLAAMWIIGILSSTGSSTHVLESVRVAFRNFLDIRDPGTYTAPERNRQLQEKVQEPGVLQFNFTEWWKFGEGEIMKEPFDVREEVVVGLLHALEMEASVQLHTRILGRFKEAQQLVKEIENQVDTLYNVISGGFESLEEEADRLDDGNLD